MSEGKLIYFVRHGETDWNGFARFQGRRNDIPLNARGLNQALRAAFRLESSKARIVCASPLQRAAQTAKAIAGDKRKLLFWQELEEQDYGVWEGNTLPYIMDNYGADYVRWKHFGLGGEITQGETETASFCRAKAVIQKLIALPDNEIIVVTHGGFLKIILIALFGMKTKPLLWNYFMGNCSISAVKIYEDGNGTPLFLNDTLHISVQAEDETELRQKIHALPLLL